MDRLVIAILCVLCPPIAVAIRYGLAPHLLISILLTVFGFWVLGVIHAIVTVFVLED